MPAGEPLTTLGEWLRWAVRELEGRTDSPRLDAEVLLAHTLEVERSYLYTWPERALPEAARARFQELVARRRAGVPVAHLTGVQEFWSLPLAVTADTLIPRPETELLVERALAHVPAQAPWRLLDLGTGSGAIALALAHERPRARVIAVELSAAALAVAERNRQALGLTNVELRRGSWYEPVRGERFHLIVANPPYIGEHEPEPQQGDTRFEPRTALIAGDAGLADLAHIIAQAPAHLFAGARLAVEHGYRQGAAVRELLRAAGLRDIETLHDLQGHERVSTARL